MPGGGCAEIGDDSGEQEADTGGEAPETHSEGDEVSEDEEWWCWYWY